MQLASDVFLLAVLPTPKGIKRLIILFNERNQQVYTIVTIFTKGQNNFTWPLAMSFDMIQPMAAMRRPHALIVSGKPLGSSVTCGEGRS